jgi:hypothetical protein
VYVEWTGGVVSTGLGNEDPIGPGGQMQILFLLCLKLR